jgi:signal peptidase II
LLLGVVLAAVVVALDLWTKALATERLALYQPVEITSWLNMTLAHNRGAAFSLLAGAGGWQRWFFTGLAVVVTAALLAWLWRLEHGRWGIALALGLVMGGAVGNVIDRVRWGYVVDFIDVHYAGWHWPAFNVADSAIFCGIILLLLDAARDTLRGEDGSGATERTEGT